MTDDQEWQGKRVTVIGGLGIEGQDLVRYFGRHGAHVLLSDRRAPDDITALRERFAGLDVSYSLGANTADDVRDADIVCISQGVPLSNPAVVAARQRGVPVESMTTLFLDRFPGPVLGITGSSGKTTTTSLVDAIFSAAGREHMLGGNIGFGLMSLLDASPLPSTWAVLEMSHTQLVLTDRSPDVAALLRVSPNHLDQFTWAEYRELKHKIFKFQDESGVVVFNIDDDVTNELRADAKGRQFHFSVRGDHGNDGAFLEGETIFWRRDGRTERVVEADEVPLRGFHNVANATGAAAIAAACDIEPDAVALAIRSFKAPEHRLEFVASVKGASYYNDSIATAPERTVAALRSFEERIVLLLGGRDKNLPLEEMLDEIKAHCRAVVCFGESGPMLAEAAASTGAFVARTDTMDAAIDTASRLAEPGDVVLLSPACTSFDAYANFEQRGIEFRRIVNQMNEGPRP